MVRIGPKAATLAGHMPPADLQGAQLQRLVRQAVRRVASKDVCDLVMDEALLTAGLSQVPDDLGQFAEFLYGPLRDAVVVHVSLEASDVVTRSMGDVVSAKVDAEVVVRDEEGQVETETPMFGGPPTVLVVENDPLARAQVSRLLRDLGYQAVTAHDGHLALAMCVRYRPGIVLAALAPGSPEASRFAGLIQVAFGADCPPLFLLAEEGVEAKPSDGLAGVLTKPVASPALEAALKPLLD